MRRATRTALDRGSRSRKADAPMLPELPADEHGEELLDEALVETFPASDPIAVPAPDDRRREQG